jgi:subtilase family serine protease
MPLGRSLSQTCTRVLVTLGVTSLIAASGFAASPRQINMGPEDTSKIISVTVWLNLHNKAGLDTLAQQIYDKASPNYHKFVTMKQFKAQFAPTAKDAVMVRNFLTSHNMNVMSIDTNNHFVVAQGRVGDAQTAFHTRINRVMVNGVLHRATTSRPSVTEPAGAVISTVQGLSDLSYQTNVSPAKNPQTG